MRALLIILALIASVTGLGYWALVGGSPTVGVPDVARGIEELRRTPGENPPTQSLAYGMKVATNHIQLAQEVAQSAPHVTENARRQQLISQLENTNNLTNQEREQIISQLWSDVGRSQEINQEIFRASLSAMSPLSNSDATADSVELRNLVNRAVGLMVATNPDSDSAAFDVAAFVERVPNAGVRKLVVDAFSASYYEGKSVIRRELAGRAIPISEEEAESVVTPNGAQ